MHPALQPTRTQRVVDRAIGIAGAIFWIVFIAVLLAGLFGLVFGL